MSWFDSCITKKEDGYIISSGSGDIVIPGDYYPLNGKASLFNHNNCDSITDIEILNLLDSIPYHIGFCYQNSETVCKVMTFYGYKATQYCGWLFLDEYTPVHHSWVVLKKGCSRHLIDLADDFTQQEYNRKEIKNANDLLEFTKWSLTLDNAVRCAPVGCPYSELVYIGCPCDASDGRKIWNDLIARYPEHVAYRHNKGSVMSPFQERLAKAGLM